ncbi:Uncharacterised protein [Mycobacterium tuberculosis]|nr:Uncharacterised protein [Mycobacterium tuberculosis]
MRTPESRGAAIASRIAVGGHSAGAEPAAVSGR